MIAIKTFKQSISVIQSMRTLILAILAVVIAACGSDDVPEKYDIYAYGSVDGVATYWKNGQPVTLGENSNSYIYDAAISGSTIYFVGRDKRAVYWENDIRHELDGTTAFSVQVDGSNVYIAGEAGTSTPYTYVAVYWKNGEPVVLGGSVGENVGAEGLAIDNGDIHVVGAEIDFAENPEDTEQRALYWKNGVLQPMDVGTAMSRFLDVVVSAGDVYIMGAVQEDNGTTVPKFWKNGEPTALAPAGGWVWDMCAHDGDIYIAGRTPGQGWYWKNGEPVAVDGNDCGSVTVVDGDVFVTAYQNATNASKLLKNGKVVSPFNGTDASINLHGVLVVKR